MPNQIVWNTQKLAKLNKAHMRKQVNLVPNNSNSLNSYQLHSQATIPQSIQTQKTKFKNK